MSSFYILNEKFREYCKVNFVKIRCINGYIYYLPDIRNETGNCFLSTTRRSYASLVQFIVNSILYNMLK